MEKAWKVVENVRDGRESEASEAALALARALVETREVALAAGVLRGGPFALRRALELAELVLDSETAEGGVPKVAVQG